MLKLALAGSGKQDTRTSRGYRKRATGKPHRNQRREKDEERTWKRSRKSTDPRENNRVWWTLKGRQTGMSDVAIYNNRELTESGRDGEAQREKATINTPKQLGKYRKKRKKRNYQSPSRTRRGRAYPKGSKRNCNAPHGSPIALYLSRIERGSGKRA